jgi:hypothetical protein
MSKDIESTKSIKVKIALMILSAVSLAGVSWVLSNVLSENVSLELWQRILAAASVFILTLGWLFLMMLQDTKGDFHE